MSNPMQYGLPTPITAEQFAALPDHVRAAVSEVREVVPGVQVSMEMGRWDEPWPAMERVIVHGTGIRPPGLSEAYKPPGPLAPGPHDAVLRSAGFTEQYPGWWVSHREEDCHLSCEHFVP